MKKLLTVLGLAFIVAGAQAQTTNVWNDTAPSGGTMNLSTLNVGGTHGDVGVFNSNTQTSTNNVSRFALSGQDWSSLAGLDWTLSADIYITSAQLADGAISEDEIYAEVAGVAGGNLTLSNAVWWTPDAWNTVYFQGTFPTAIGSLTSASAAFVNNDQTNHPAGDNYQIDNVNLEVGLLEDVVWDDQNPIGGNMALSQIADPFGTGHGNIGAFTDSGAAQWQNYNSGAQDLSAYAGRKWRFSCDIYLTTAQLTNSAVADDQLYWSFAGSAGGWTLVSDFGFVADAWNTITWSGTLAPTPSTLTAANFLFLDNDMTTQPVGIPNFYLDNFLLEIESAPQPAKDTLWTDAAPEGGNALITLTNDIFATGHGDIGVFNSAAVTNQWTSFGTSGNNWSNYAGKSWTMSLDIYLTSAQMTDTNITDDQIYYSVAGVPGGWKGIDSAGFTADAWNKVTWNGAFVGDGSTLTNVTVQLVINDQLTNPTSGDNFYVDNFKFEAVAPVEEIEMDTLFTDSNPSDGNMSLVSIADPFATGQGNIGMFESDTDGGQFSNYGLTGKDWGAYVGQDWTLSADVYITAAQVADALITDDTIYCQVGGVAGGFTSVSTLSADAWNTLTWTGTFTNEPLLLANTGVLFLNNDATTHPVAGKNYFVDNFLLEAVTPATTSPPPIYVYQTNDIEFIVGEGYADGVLNGQDDWVANTNWTVDTASGGSVVCTNDNARMTLVQVHPIGEGTTVDFTVNYKVQGTHAPTVWSYPARIGITRLNSAANIGYDAGGNSVDSAVITLQAHPSVLDQYRCFGDGWNGPQTLVIDGDPGDEWAMHFSLTLGSDNEATTFAVVLENVTKSLTQPFTAGNVETSVGADLYSALVSGNAYAFFNSGGFQDGLTGLEVLGVTLSYPEEIADKYILWAQAKELSGANALAANDPDQDGLANLGEYVFGGDPHAATGGNDQGIQPVLDGLTYKYSLIGDSFVEVKVMTSTDLPAGFTVSDTFTVTAEDGVLSEYTFDASGYNELFLKVEVTRDTN